MSGTDSQQIDKLEPSQANAPSFTGGTAQSVLSVPLPHACGNHAFVTRLPQWVAAPCGTFLLVEVTIHHDSDGTRFDVSARSAQADSKSLADAMDAYDACGYGD
jgi:hypothetical protein